MEGDDEITSITPLLQLPDELFGNILQYLDPVETVAFGSACRRIYKSTLSSLLWLRHCRETWKHWHPRHDLETKLALPPGQTEWRQLYYLRARQDHNTLAAFNKLLATQTYRYTRMTEIAKQGYDIIDLMVNLKNNTPDSAEDVLCRRYHANAILGQAHRINAVTTWMTLLTDVGPAGFENSLHSFDLFVLTAAQEDAFQVVRELDSLAQRIRETHEAFASLSSRQKAILIAQFLRAENIVGLSQETDYHALYNNFLSAAIKCRSSLPLQSAAVYCAVAQRLGVDATPSNFPQHVHVVIRASNNETLVGSQRQLADNAQIECMHLDPWRSSEEIMQDQLALQLSRMGISETNHSSFLGATTTAAITRRAARNLMVSVERARHDDAARNAQPEIETAWYCMLWVMVILGHQEETTITNSRRHFMPFLIEHLQAHFPEDLGLMEFLPSLFERQPEQQALRELLEALRKSDATKLAKPRAEQQGADVAYHIGDHFKHKRYGYKGFIIGWDAQCNAGSRWITQMRVDDLPRGRQQPFYNIVAEDKSSRYVAEENIQIIQEQPSAELLSMAGRYFKSWNDSKYQFKSNMKQEYPDD